MEAAVSLITLTVRVRYLSVTARMYLNGRCSDKD
jgi:hypothetical protein